MQSTSSSTTNSATPSKEEPFREDLNVKLICPDCRNPHPNIHEDHKTGDLICKDCGTILGDRIVDTRSEWRTFANDDGDDPSRVGGPQDPLLDGADQLSTVISFRDGNTGHAADLQRAARQLAHNTGEQSLVNAFREFTRYGDIMSLPKNIIDTAKQYYKQATDEKLFKGKSTEASIAASLFIACRQGGVQRTFKEINKITRVPVPALAECFQILRTRFGGDTESNPLSLISRYCNHLDLPSNVQGASRKVVENILHLGTLDGRSPVTIASVCIFFTCNLFHHPRTTKQVAEVSNMNDATIKQAYRLLYTVKDKVVDDGWFSEERPEKSRADWSALPQL